MIAANTNEPPPASVKSQEEKANGCHRASRSKAWESTSMPAIIERNESIDARPWMLADAGSGPPAIGKMAAIRTPTDHTASKIRPTRQRTAEPRNGVNPRESASDPTESTMNAVV